MRKRTRWEYFIGGYWWPWIMFAAWVVFCVKWAIA
jgi:hypothetical protein